MKNKMLTIDDEFRGLIPPLSSDEYQGLQESILSEGCRDPLVVWDSVILDGHNRYKICMEHGLIYSTVEKNFDSRDDAKVWIIKNQFGRRNLIPYERSRLALKLEGIIAAKAKEKQRESGGAVPQKSAKPPIDTREELSKLAHVSHDTIHKVKTIEEKATDDIKEQARTGKLSVNEAYSKVTQDLERKEVKQRLDELEQQEIKKPTGKYDVLIIDPPWEMHKIERICRPNQVEQDYPTMTIEQLEVLELPLADDCHVWLWTTQKHLPNAFKLLDAWGLNYICTFVWHKPGGIQPVHLPQYNCEFILYARKGTPQFLDTKDFNTCFQADRKGHSVKPDYFYEMVKRVTGGRRLDMYARKKHDGFKGWGKEYEPNS